HLALCCREFYAPGPLIIARLHGPGVDAGRLCALVAVTSVARLLLFAAEQSLAARRDGRRRCRSDHYILTFDQFQHNHGSAVSSARTDLRYPRVSALPVLESWSNLIEQMRDHVVRIERKLTRL